VKFILSRKGFDSSFGGHPSPIMPDGSLLSLPIPVEPRTYGDADRIRYAQLRTNKQGSYLDLMKRLGIKRLAIPKRELPLNDQTRCHLDPDLNQLAIPGRDEGWRGAFGQCDAAEGHLMNMGIQKDDVFLFFGWFQEVVGQRFRPGDRGRHVLFGYLQVEEAVRNRVKPESWPYEHPHFQYGYTHRPDGRRRVNGVYLARPQLTLPGHSSTIPGFGTFKFHDALVLTKKGHSRSRWALPEFFRGIEVSYHGGSKYGWKVDHFQSAYKGQEFVFDATAEAVAWFREEILYGTTS
jgi:hypothetical protein